MIQTLLKHSLYEHAIDVLFFTIQGNFHFIKEEFQVGSSFNELVIEESYLRSTTIKLSYVDCIVVAKHGSNLTITHNDLIIEIFFDGRLHEMNHRTQPMTTIIGIEKITGIKQ